MQSLDRDQISLHMDASPADVYALVADVTRMPEFSPEILSCTWLDGATGPAVGARFAARNRVSSGFKWTNKPVVIATEPTRHFAISRTEKMGGTLEWHYRFEPDGDGTLVTESYEVTKRIPALGWFFIGLAARTKDRRGDMRKGMEQTLQRMKAVVETGTRGKAKPAAQPAPGAVAG
jgi:hypothetical protein